jgi:hypothetical protein
MVKNQPQCSWHRIEEARKVSELNTTRGLIELICIEARELGYDALHGREIDKHSENGEVIAQPWLAVFRKGVVRDPTWI